MPSTETDVGYYKKPAFTSPFFKTSFKKNSSLSFSNPERYECAIYEIKVIVYWLIQLPYFLLIP